MTARPPSRRAGRRRSRRPSARARRAPILPMSWSSAPSSDRLGSSAARHASSTAIGSPLGSSSSEHRRPARVRNRCTSTVNRWYGSRCGRLRTSRHPGRNRTSRPRRSSTSRAATPPSPAADQPQEGVARRPSSHSTGDGIDRRPRSSVGGRRVRSCRPRRRGPPALGGPVHRRASACGTAPRRARQGVPGRVDRPSVLEDRPHQPVIGQEPGFVDEAHLAATRAGARRTGRSARLPGLELQRAPRPGRGTPRRPRSRPFLRPGEAGPSSGLADRGVEPSQCRMSRRPPSPSFRSGDRSAAQEPAVEARRARSCSDLVCERRWDRRPPRRPPRSVAAVAERRAPASSRPSSIAVRESSRSRAASTHSVGVRTSGVTVQPCVPQRIPGAARPARRASAASTRRARAAVDVGAPEAATRVRTRRARGARRRSATRLERSMSPRRERRNAAGPPNDRAGPVDTRASSAIEPSAERPRHPPSL